VPARWLLILVCILEPAVARAWNVIPIPEFIADPNEGNTHGILPVVLFTDEEDRIRYMLSPDFALQWGSGCERWVLKAPAHVFGLRPCSTRIRTRASS